MAEDLRDSGVLELLPILTTFGLIFVAELPDKSAITSLVLGTKYPWPWVFSGVAGAFLVHVVIAVGAGSLLSLLPQKPLEILISVLFLVGAFLIWREGNEDVTELKEDEESDLAETPSGLGFAKVASLSFGIVFIAEWGDLTQILMANLTARYHSPLSVGIGGTLALWAVALIAILGGKHLLRVLPMRTITRVAAAIMIGLCMYTLIKLLSG